MKNSLARHEQENNMTAVWFTPETRDKLRAAYDKAKADGKETFWFDCVEYVVAYAGYLLEHLDEKFGVRK